MATAAARAVEIQKRRTPPARPAWDSGQERRNEAHHDRYRRGAGVRLGREGRCPRRRSAHGAAAPAAAFAPAPLAFNWSGVYLGINGGYGFGSSSWTDALNPAGSSGNFSTDGFLVGGTLGFNYQVDQFVIGAEADLDWSGLKGNISNSFCTVPLTAAAAPASTTCETQNTWLGTVRARFGYAVDRVLLYATGGGAFGNVEAGLTGGGVGTPTYQTSTHVGWTAGAGIEWAFAGNWTARAEYLYVDLGRNASCNASAACGFDNPAAGVFVPASDAVKFTASLVRAGLDYKFGD